MDLQVRAVKNGWLPFYPQFNQNPLEIVKEAEAALARGASCQLAQGQGGQAGSLPL
ncbi:MAG: hypothetical protein HY289_08865 [Planctomycetes bacterium]|nr:hypothetical protein [Planctomycetota bacterium]